MEHLCWALIIKWIKACKITFKSFSHTIPWYLPIKTTLSSSSPHSAPCHLARSLEKAKCAHGYFLPLAASPFSSPCYEYMPAIFFFWVCWRISWLHQQQWLDVYILHQLTSQKEHYNLMKKLNSWAHLYGISFLVLPITCKNLRRYLGNTERDFQAPQRK